MKSLRKSLFQPGLLLSLLLLTACIAGPPTAESPQRSDPGNENLRLLQQRLATLEARAQRIRDSNDIKRLQRAYGYYMDEQLWDEVVNLFTEDATFEYARDGLYRGRDRIRSYLEYFGSGEPGLESGQLSENFMLMPVISLAEDGNSAKGRWRALLLAGELGDNAAWGEGPFENEYVKQDGVWKISRIRWYQTIMVPYDGGWAANEDINGGVYVSDRFPPDSPPSETYGSWPETFLPPFHFSNPVAPYQPQSSPQGGAQ